MCDVKQTVKATVICDLVEDKDIDILAITETWLSTNDSISTGRITPAGYQLLHVPRVHGIDGCVAVVYKSTFVTRQLDTPNAKTFELMGLHISNGPQSTRLIVVYRPPPNTKNGYATSEFLAEFSQLMDSMAMDTSNVLVAVDFNFHMDNISNNDTRRFLDLLEVADLYQHVEDPTIVCPTDVAGHTIDFLITRLSNSFLNNIRIDIPHMSDHSAIHCTLRLTKPPNTQVTTTTRSYKRISTAALCEDIRSLLLSKHMSDTNCAVETYNETIEAIVDKHAPLTTRTVTVRPHTPWYNDSIRATKCLRDASWNENAWRTTEIECDRLAYCLQRQLITSSIHRAKLEYHMSQIADASGDQKKMFKTDGKPLK